MQIPSDKVVFNEKPDMKAREITDAGKAALASGKYDMVRINYANPDMVGHTGDLKATMQVRFLPSQMSFCLYVFPQQLCMFGFLHLATFRTRIHQLGLLLPLLYN